MTESYCAPPGGVNQGHTRGLNFLFQPRPQDVLGIGRVPRLRGAPVEGAAPGVPRLGLDLAAA